MIIGNTRRKVLLNLSNNEVEMLAKELKCSILLVTVEDELYKRTIGMDLKQYKNKIKEIIRGGN